MDETVFVISDTAKISKLGDRPNRDDSLKAAQLKAKFDAAAKELCEYLNKVAFENGTYIKVADEYKDIDGNTKDNASLKQLVDSITSGVLARYFNVDADGLCIKDAYRVAKARDIKSFNVSTDGDDITITPNREAFPFGSESDKYKELINTAIGPQIPAFNIPKSVIVALAKAEVTTLKNSINNNSDIDVSYNSGDGMLKITAKFNGTAKSKEVNLPLESSITDIDDYVKDGKHYLTLTLASGSKTDIELNELFEGYAKSEELNDYYKKTVSDKRYLRGIAGKNGVIVKSDEKISGSFEANWDEWGKAYELTITSALPIKPGSLRVNNYAAGFDFIDNGNGQFTFDGEVSGSINYETGECSVPMHITLGNTNVYYIPDIPIISLSTPLSTINSQISKLNSDINGVEEALAMLNEGGTI